MKSKYCFLRTNGQLTPGDVVYQVWVGSFLREFTKLTLVQEYCKDCGLYIEKWSPQVDSRLEKMKALYGGGASVLSSPFLSASITISKLYALIIDDSFESFERNLFLSQSEKWCRYHQTIKYIGTINRSNVIQNAYPHVRKHLSSRNRLEGQKALFYTACVAILIVIDAVVSHFMNW